MLLTKCILYISVWKSFANASEKPHLRVYLLHPISGKCQVNCSNVSYAYIIGWVLHSWQCEYLKVLLKTVYTYTHTHTHSCITLHIMQNKIYFTCVVLKFIWHILVGANGTAGRAFVFPISGPFYSYVCLPIATVFRTKL